MTTGEYVAQVALLIERTKFRFNNEAELQAAIAARFRDAKISVLSEHHLDEHSRIDFLVPLPPGGIGVEVKVKGSQTDVLRQICRYAESPEIAGLVVVTTKRRHITQHTFEANGKPVRFVWLGANVFVQ